MELFKITENELRELFENINYQIIVNISKYMIDDLIKENFIVLPEVLKNKRFNILKSIYVGVFVRLFQNQKFKEKLYLKLTQTKTSKEIYEKLVWSEFNHLNVKDFDLKLKPLKDSVYAQVNKLSENELFLIQRKTRFKHNKRLEYDMLELERDSKKVLKLVFPVPFDFYILPSIEIQNTEFTYTNENEILEFISTIKAMLKNNLVKFTKNGEKPLVKTLNILKSSTSINEFYSEKGFNNFAMDMLIRSFFHLHSEKNGFKQNKKELIILKDFIKFQLNDDFSFTISRIFTSHLKSIRFGYFHNEQTDLFNIILDIIKQLPKENWVNVNKIFKYCNYRDYKFHFESDWKTDEYYIESSDGEIKSVCHHYQLLFFRPIIKACFFYLAALGLFELKYDIPISEDQDIQEGYVSTWDGLKQIKLTELGKYILGFNKTYTQKAIVRKKTKLKFDEYKPIITVDKSDTLMIAKLEPLTDKYDTDRYILSYKKFFKDCKKLKELELRIDGFYKQIEPNPPQVFKDFFNQIKSNSNLLKRDLKQVVIEIKNNKKLLNLFMTNSKLQELIIKAQGYRIIVEKENISKLTKIVKDNGFFVEF